MHKRVSHKRKIKFGDYNYCLEATQLENEINPLGKNSLNVDNLRKSWKIYKKNKLILKSQQRFRNEKKLFPEQVNRLHWVLMMIKEYSHAIH